MTGTLVTCVGCGVVGRSWAQLCAVHGIPVNIFDNERGRAESVAGEIIRKVGGAPHVRALNKLDDALAGATYVQESIPEDLEAKQRLFRELDEKAAPGTIIGSSTSQYRGSLFTGGLRGASRCLVVHPINPVAHLPVVEIVPTPSTSAATVAGTVEMMKTLKRIPVVLQREIRGFILNRLQLALVGEALHLVREGVCEPDDVDRIMKYGLGLRWAVFGPFEAMQLNADGGCKEYLTKFGPLMEGLVSELKLIGPVDEALVDRIAEAVTRKIPLERIGDMERERNRLFDKIQATLSAETGKSSGTTGSGVN